MLKGYAMKRYRNLIFYVGVTGLFFGLIYWIVQIGENLDKSKVTAPLSGINNQWVETVASLNLNFGHPLAVLLAQIITILLVTRIFGWICRKIGQPTVIGEIAAGVALGPSLLGIWFPDLFASLFPPESLGNLNFLSQIGLILFMFIIGIELDFNLLKNKVNDAIIISHASIIVPFTFGMGLALFIYASFAPPGVHFLAFALFLGIVMSITAFPVLARIVQENGMSKTNLGVMVITCAAINDVTAWSILAMVIAIVKAGSVVSSLFTIMLSVGYVVLMLKVVRPFLARIGELHTSRENLTKPFVAIFFLVLMISAFTTEIIGIHAIFGGFMAGAIMPNNVKFRNIFVEKVEDVALVLFMPLFFVFTGLRTQIGLLNDLWLWQICILITLVAVAGKFIGSSLSARFTGQTWKDSLTIGTLMNTRGLVELVVLNIGFDLGILSSQVFAMLVIMALVTTFMTGPVLELIRRIFKTTTDHHLPETAPFTNFRILLSFGNPESGRSLLKLAHRFIKSAPENSQVTALHLSPADELFQYNIDEYEKESFYPIIDESQNLQQKVTTLFKVSKDLEADIASAANKGGYDLLLIGTGQSIFEGSLLGKVLGFTARIINPTNLYHKVTGKEKFYFSAGFDERIRLIVSRTDIPIGIYIDKRISPLEKLVVFFSQDSDTFLFEYIRKLTRNDCTNVSFIDPDKILHNNQAIPEDFRGETINSAGWYLKPDVTDLENENFQSFGLMLISISGWAYLVDHFPESLTKIPPTLILTA
jgi:Kef-type K+ transport system membrane component KefB